MDWNPKTWKFNWKSDKGRWLLVLAVGLIFLLLSFPSGKKNVTTENDVEGGRNMSYGLEGGSERAAPTAESGAGAGTQEDPSASALAYEQQMEERLRSILSRVDGVGTVEVMIVLRSSEQKVWHTDRSTSTSSTRETDANGGSRQVQSQSVDESTILTDQGAGDGPLLEKELYPEIGGVVVSASGGGSPVVQAEISAAVEALFGVPSHKIKILKRVE